MLYRDLHIYSSSLINYKNIVLILLVLSHAGVVRSKWGREEYSRGGLTFLPCGATNEDICELGRPVPGTDQCGHPVLLFAGESTAPGYVGSLLGAHLSGIREADRIIQLTRKFSGPPPH